MVEHIYNGKPKNSGLTKWFKEDWRDVKTGKKCGRSGKDKSQDLILPVDLLK